MNTVNLIGRLTKDNEMKITNSGKAVVSFTLAVNRRGAKEGEQQADFINCVAWGKVAENMSVYTGKGSLIAVTGKINTRNYENQNGQKVYVTEVLANGVTFLSKRSNEAPANNNAYQGQNEPNWGGFDTGMSVNIGDNDLPF